MIMIQVETTLSNFNLKNDLRVMQLANKNLYFGNGKYLSTTILYLYMYLSVRLEHIMLYYQAALHLHLESIYF